jgi:PhnB protein
MTIDGCAAAIDLYKKAFGAVEIDRAPDPSGKKVWHAHIKIGDSAVFVNDVFPEMGGAPNHSSLWIYTDNVDAAFKRAVDAGLEVKMPLTDMFWGDRMGSLKDRWGNSWTLAQRIWLDRRVRVSRLRAPVRAGSSVAERWPYKPDVAGSIPVPPTACRARFGEFEEQRVRGGS